MNNYIYIIGRSPLTHRFKIERIKYKKSEKRYLLYKESDILLTKSIPINCDKLGCEYKDAWYTFNEEDARDYWEAVKCM